jgi:hypothetical protein
MYGNINTDEQTENVNTARELRNFILLKTPEFVVYHILILSFHICSAFESSFRNIAVFYDAMPV